MPKKVVFDAKLNGEKWAGFDMLCHTILLCIRTFDYLASILFYFARLFWN